MGSLLPGLLLLVLLVDSIALFVQLLPCAESSEGTLAMCVDMLKSVDVAGVDPTEAAIVSEMSRTS
jgi:hypothetical protein